MVNTKYNFKGLAFALALMLVTGCSSSPVEEGDEAPPVETADEASIPAPTDAVPSADGLAATPAVAEDPNLASQAPMPAPEQSIPQLAPEVTADAASELSMTAPLSSTPDPVVENSAPVQSTPMASGEPSQYRVKKGDTLMKIAFEQYGDLYRWREIYEANRDVISDPSHVPPGTKITLNGAGQVQIEKNGERYKIKTGDTLGIISNTVYGTPKKWKSLWENNRQMIKNPNKIYAGFFLYYQPDTNRLTNDQNSPATPSSAAPETGASTVPAAPVEPAVDQRAPASK